MTHRNVTKFDIMPFPPSSYATRSYAGTAATVHTQNLAGTVFSSIRSVSSA